MPLAAYCFLRAVGKGSYGEVSLVRHRHDSKQYVIKKLNLKNASIRERKAAEQEAQLLSQLKHPNIVAYRESWQGEDGLLYIVMGFCEGGDLYHKLKEQKGKLLPESQVVEWFVQIAMALQYLHEKHILHRDLKTQNVFLTRTNIIKVGDLGIARVLENQYDMASTLIGTPYYMSPELFSNKPYNCKSDVWALGCCVYEMATLKHAFNAKDMNALAYRIIEGKLPPMPKDYSPHLVEIIRTMLSKKPEERPSVKIILIFVSTKFCAPEKSPVELKTKPSSNDSNSLGESLATISEVNIDILTSEKGNYEIEKCGSEHIPENNKSKCVNVPGNSKISSSPPVKADGLQKKTKRAFKAESAEPKPSSLAAVEEDDDTLRLLQPISEDQKQTDLDDVCHGASGDAQEKITSQLQPHSSAHEPSLSRQRRQKKRELAEVCSEKFRAAAHQPSPFPSNVNAKTVQRCAEEYCAEVSESVNSTKNSQVAISKERPLSARERRRLKQSREETFPSGNFYVCMLDRLITSLRRNSNLLSKNRVAHCLSDEELSSSTSSTDKSDGDSKEKKSSMNEVNDLVQLMTWTLKMDSKENSEHCVASTPAPEFKLHRKYRDTLNLHGKSPDESEEFKFQEIPSGPEKIRRLVEILRSDVVQGLGVKLLEKVYSIMEEDDEVKRELQLREHMGDKYTSYSAKARHLKFLEENVKF
uniref:Serine/threonine-protein kinase Nek4 n=1 Tax=Cairina moschata TaxID=8855 RepID=A0A8C3CS42_CAIMO